MNSLLAGEQEILSSTQRTFLSHVQKHQNKIKVNAFTEIMPSDDKGLDIENLYQPY